VLSELSESLKQEGLLMGKTLGHKKLAFCEQGERDSNLMFWGPILNLPFRGFPTMRSNSCESQKKTTRRQLVYKETEMFEKRYSTRGREGRKKLRLSG